MQLTKRNIYDKCIMGIAALIWVLGLLTAGSDSIYMPWLNVVGAILFLVASLWLGRVLPRLEASGSVVSRSGLAKTRGTVRPRVRVKFFEKKQNSKINTRYAQGWSVV